MPEPLDLPFGAGIDDDQLWSQVLNRVQNVPGIPPLGDLRRPALFLDRDGVIVEDAHYLHRPEDVRMIPGAAEVIARANTLGVPVIVVTNQAGIARGKFAWQGFVKVQETIIETLDSQGAFLNAVFACPHHKDGKAPFDNPNHPWRKPNPGMLLEAAQRLPVDLSKSWLIGDREADVRAAKTAGLQGALHVLTGHGQDAGEREGAVALDGDGFQCLTAESVGEAGEVLPILGK
ncbi:MAG: HAD family hydrolase [Alphaproteobacteria bacterium]|nr:HAD family hydrolase [Alphaproteobacteria bacterium]